MKRQYALFFLVTWLLLVTVAACSSSPEQAADGNGRDSAAALLALPNLAAVTERNGPVRIVATTGIIGDVATAIAGADAEVSALMAPNQDPHGYQSTAGDLQLVAEADAVLVNGWGLEEGLLNDLDNAAGDVLIVPVSAGFEPRSFSDAGAGDHSLRIDPHVWLAPENVIQWVNNIEFVLSTLDPAHSEDYAARAGEYRTNLIELDAYISQQVERIDSSRRIMVTNHDAFGYFADAYGFSIVGTIIPGDSSLAEPASRDLATLVERMSEASACAIFTEHSASQRLAAQLAGELEYCDEVQIVLLYTGALGDEGSGAETYLTMMKTNIDLIVEALQVAPGSTNTG